jgi:WhiB family redox-sensing transcriptional regulator
MNYAGGALVEAPWWESSSPSLPEALPCHLVDPEVFFAEARDCPVREACLAGAMERREPWGVWGGELFIAGVVVARKRPRGRPRKHPVTEPYGPAAELGGRKEAAA